MKKRMINVFKSLILPLAVYLFFLLLNFERFGNIRCFYTVFLQSITPTIIGYAVSFGFICGVLDFSVGSRIVLAGLIGGVSALHFGIVGLVFGSLVSSIIAGTITGAVNWLFRIPSLVVTLGLTLVFEIIGYHIAGSSSLIRLAPNNVFLGSAPNTIYVLFVVGVIFYFVFYYSRFSYHARAVGNEETISKNVGIKVPYTKFLTFVVGSVFLGVAAVLQLSAAGTLSAQVNMASASMLFKPLMGVMVALAIMPICNLAVGIFIGEFCINTIFVGLIASGLPDTFQDVVLGLFMLIVMLITMNKDGINTFTHRAVNRVGNKKMLSTINS